MPETANKSEQLTAALASVTIENLAELVRLMRDTQKAYFKTRDTNALNESKALERQVDAAIARVLSKQGAML